MDDKTRQEPQPSPANPTVVRVVVGLLGAVGILVFAADGDLLAPPTDPGQAILFAAWVLPFVLYLVWVRTLEGSIAIGAGLLIPFLLLMGESRNGSEEGTWAALFMPLWFFPLVIVGGWLDGAARRKRAQASRSSPD